MIQDNQFTRGMALSHVGDNVTHWLDTYQRMNVMSPSVRYYNWYNTTKAEAQQRDERYLLLF
jgi:hypothetical protein